MAPDPGILMAGCTRLELATSDVTGQGVLPSHHIFR